jgi:hypothetical protein
MEFGNGASQWPFVPGIKQLINGDLFGSVTMACIRYGTQKKIEGQWYIYKQFTINGDTCLSRQDFIPQPDGTVLRVSEKTYDEKKWELRFKQRLKKIK